MEIAVEISLYPLDAAFIPPIQAFIDRLNAAERLKVVTTSLSTQVFGEYEDVLGTLAREMRTKSSLARTYIKNLQHFFCTALNTRLQFTRN